MAKQDDTQNKADSDRPEVHSAAPESAEPVPDKVAEADEESFPASDAPGWNPLHSGPPKA